MEKQRMSMKFLSDEGLIIFFAIARYLFCSIISGFENIAITGIISPIPNNSKPADMSIKKHKIAALKRSRGDKSVQNSKIGITIVSKIFQPLTHTN